MSRGLHITEEEALRLGWKQPASTEAQRTLKAASREKLELEFIGHLRRLIEAIPVDAGVAYRDRAVGVLRSVERNYRFLGDRRFELDFVVVEARLGVEIQGLVPRGREGGHQSFAGVRRDTRKLRAAALAGWTILPCVREDLAVCAAEFLAEAVRRTT